MRDPVADRQMLAALARDRAQIETAERALLLELLTAAGLQVRAAEPCPNGAWRVELDLAGLAGPTATATASESAPAAPVPAATSDEPAAAAPEMTPPATTPISSQTKGPEPTPATATSATLPLPPLPTAPVAPSAAPTGTAPSTQGPALPTLVPPAAPPAGMTAEVAAEVATAGDDDDLAIALPALPPLPSLAPLAFDAPPTPAPAPKTVMPTLAGVPPLQPLPPVAELHLDATEDVEEAEEPTLTDDADTTEAPAVDDFLIDPLAAPAAPPVAPTAEPAPGPIDLGSLHTLDATPLRVRAGEKRKNHFRLSSDNPRSRAQRLARTLIGDMIAYRPDDHRRALAEGIEAIRTIFGEELETARERFYKEVDAASVPDRDAVFVAAVNELLGNNQPVLA